MSDAAPAVTATTRVRLHELAVRQDGAEWIVGRMDMGTFVALPEAGKQAIDLLGRGMSVADVAEALRSGTGQDIDVPDFVGALIGLDFVAEADDRPIPSRRPPVATFPWLLPRHVRFVLSPVVPILVGVLVVAAAITLLRRPDLSLSYHDLLWSRHGSLVIALSAGAGWTLLLIHEFAHLAAARATGVPGRIRLGTRLQFLVMQTDISGIELAPRRRRMTAYLAGIATNLTAAAIALLLAAVTDPATTLHRILTALVLLALLPLPFQLMVFMRTDLYFVLQDLTGCRDLYGEGAAYARYVTRRIRGAFRRHPPPLTDPSRRLPRNERRAVRAYSVVQVLGTAACLAFLVSVTLPADITLLARAATGLRPENPVVQNLDAAAVLIVLGGLHLLWAVTWWRNRRRRSTAARAGS